MCVRERESFQSRESEREREREIERETERQGERGGETGRERERGKEDVQFGKLNPQRTLIKFL